MKKILYFSSTWCQPCKNFKPIMERVSRELPVEFIDIDANPQLVAEYGIKILILLKMEITHNQFM